MLAVLEQVEGIGRSGHLHVGRYPDRCGDRVVKNGGTCATRLPRNAHRAQSASISVFNRDWLEHRLHAVLSAWLRHPMLDVASLLGDQSATSRNGSAQRACVLHVQTSCRSVSRETCQRTTDAIGLNCLLAASKHCRSYRSGFASCAPALGCSSATRR